LGSEKTTDVIRLWETDSGKQRCDLEQSAATFYSLFSPNCQFLAAAQSEKELYSVKIWDTATGRLHRVVPPMKLFPRRLAFAPDSKTLALVRHEHAQRTEIQQWDIATGHEVAAQHDPLPDLRTMVISPDGTVLALAGGDMDPAHRGIAYGKIILWDLVAGQERGRLGGHRSVVWSLAFSPDGRTLASGGFDYLTKLWDTTTGVELATLEGHQSTVLTAAFAPDGQTLATGSYDQTVKLWSAPAPTVVLPPWSLRGQEGMAFGHEPNRDDHDWAKQLARDAKFKELLDEKRQMAQENPSNERYVRALADGFSALASVQFNENQREAAAASLQQALPFFRRLTEAIPASEERQANLSKCLSNLGDLQQAIGETASALKHGREALEIRRKLVEARPDDLDQQSLLGGSYNNVGMALHIVGELREALAHFEKAIEHQRRAFDAKPGVLQYRRFLRNHYANLASVRRALNQPAEAVAAALASKELIPKDAENLYRVAQELAQCVPLTMPQQEAERKMYTDLAIATLREAIEAGFQPLDSVRRNGAFNAIREQPGFQTLIQGIKKKTPEQERRRGDQPLFPRRAGK
jgi:tetratricopeptide (TPR) repeat protein